MDTQGIHKKNPFHSGCSCYSCRISNKSAKHIETKWRRQQRKKELRKLASNIEVNGFG